MKILRGKLPLSIMAIVVCILAFAVLIFTEDLWAITGTSIFKYKSCSKKDPVTNSSKIATEVKEKQKVTSFDDDFIDEDNNYFDSGERCSIEKGKWVFNTSAELFYTDQSCPYLDKQISCLKNGRSDSDYLYWEWQLDDCILPRFNAAALLEKLRGKRLMFSGDSLQREQWQSLVCMVESHIPTDKKKMKRGRTLSVFKIENYNATIEFYWAPYLVESNSDEPIIRDTKKRILRVDSIAKHAQHWVGVDYLVFNSYVWWTSDPKMKSLWGSFANGDEGYEELDSVVAFRMALKTWANWIDSNVNRSSTRVFFTTASPTHMRSGDWKRQKPTRCYNETRPVTGREYWGSGSNKKMMEVVSGVVSRMKFSVTFINITQLTDYRKDGHVSVYTGELSDKQKADPQTFADCIHWCLPGVPDTWNKILYAYL
ncbi:protein trichome birefringence-like 3 [Phalaenopsis equestris]|uniref:protein trichome birefringence-like 3 n=1 Tax=Phalaenopsis equestris TaxID=78828 RepID=UPI0009E4DFCF|nr:protein trichome birefringence-like 3 [Phalaenopsis equestris]